MSADLMTSSTELTEGVANTSAMDTSADIVTTDIEEKQINGADEDPTTAGKRKRSTKKAVEQIDNVPNGRPKRNLSKRK
jgi:hypothetical protein